MATESKTYVEFEPYSEWKKDADSETLIIHLPEFKRTQLRVQVNTHGILKVSGEKPEEGKTQTKRFYKESNIPQGCDINDIRAKFSNGCLHVIMPKKKEPHTKPETSGVRDDEKQDAPKKAPTTSTTTHQKDDQVFGNGNAILRLIERQKKKKKLVVNVGIGIAVAAVVAIGAYVAIKYGSDSATATTTSSSAQMEEVRPN